MVTLESTRTFTPISQPKPGKRVTSLSKRVPPKSPFRHPRIPLSGNPKAPADSAAHVSLSSFFACQRPDQPSAHRRQSVAGPIRLPASSPIRGRSRGSLQNTTGQNQGANSPDASGAPPSLCAVYRTHPPNLSTHQNKLFSTFPRDAKARKIPDFLTLGKRPRLSFAGIA